MSHWSAYRCPTCNVNMCIPRGTDFSCENGHIFSLLAEQSIPAFEFQAEDINEYSIENAAEIHDNALTWLLKTHHISEDDFRNDVLSKLNLKAGQRVLITGVGAGNDLPYICKKIGPTGVVYAQDFSQQMLFAAHDRVKNKFGLGEYDIFFSLSDAVILPFQTDYFDTVYHFGGLNIFSNIEKGILEMDRVVKDGGRVVIGDEGLAPWVKKTEMGQMLLTNNPLYKHCVPLEFLPENSQDVQVNWTINNCYYIVSYTSSKEGLKINTDLPHLGVRGGTIKKRHLGVLEGINPLLKQRVYDAAANEGLSRVDFLEKIISSGVENLEENKK